MKGRGFRKGFDRTSGFFGRFSKGAELKFFDIDLDDAVVTTSAAITDSVNKIPQGTTESTRIGRKCTIRSINWRFEARLPDATTSGSTADTLRVIMYLDKQCNGATATSANIFEVDDYQSFNNLGNKSRFRTLMDRQYDLQASLSGDGTTLDSGVHIISDSFFKKVNIPIEFDSTAGAITEIKSNNIGVLLITKAGLAGFNSKLRLRYSDN